MKKWRKSAAPNYSTINDHIKIVKINKNSELELKQAPDSQWDIISNNWMKFIINDLKNEFDITIYNPFALNFSNLKKIPDALWMFTGLGKPDVDKYKHFYFISFGFKINEDDYIIKSDNSVSNSEDSDIMDYLNNGGINATTSGAYKIGDTKYRICQWYFNETSLSAEAAGKLLKQ